MMVTTVERVQKIWDMIGGEEVVDALINGRAKLEVKWIQDLDWRGTIITSVTTEKFFAKEKFYKNSKEVKFYRSWVNFTNWFLVGNGKIEEPIGEQELRYGNLVKDSVDSLIIDKLGGEAKAETTLAEMYDLLKKQRTGGDGVLLTNGYGNIFYIRDISGVLRAVSVHWHDGGWNVSAGSIASFYDWPAGHRVFSRNS